MLLNLPKRISGGIDDAPFPYTFPLLSTESLTGVRTDWTNSDSSMAAQGGGTGRWVLENGSTDRVFTYQEFAAGLSRYAVIDAGNAVIDLSHDIDTLDSDSDGGCAFVEFYDGSSVFLGKVFTTNQLTDTSVVDSITGKRVPTGTRTIRIGWQAANHTGTELSVYVKDIACTIRQETTVVWDDTVVVFSEREADLTGWTTTTGLFNTITGTAADWEWASVQAYFGGNTSLTSAYKNFSFPTGWAAKVAAGDVGFILRAGAHNANQDDNVQVTVRLNNGSTNPTVTTGYLSLVFQMEFIELTGAIPSDTTSIDIILDFDRNDGTANDGAVDCLSLLLYEII